MPRRPSPTTVCRLSGPAELVQGVPQLLGFHPQRSLVLVGLESGRVGVTARLDLDDVDNVDNVDDVDNVDNGCHETALADTARALVRGGCAEVVALLYDDGPLPTIIDRHPALICRLIDLEQPVLLDILLVAGGRWRSCCCDSPECCPVEGTPVPETPSEFVMAATVAGRVALPNRQALTALLDPEPEERRSGMAPLLESRARTAAAADTAGRGEQADRSVTRALFRAARAAQERPWRPPSDSEAARFGIGLRRVPVRDSVWRAIDGGRLDGRELWRNLARRLPAPHDAAPMFLFGWVCWRDGNGALAGEAATRALAADGAYRAAELLATAVQWGLDPRQLPRIGRA